MSLFTRGCRASIQQRIAGDNGLGFSRVGFSNKPLRIVKAVNEVGSGMKGHRRGVVGQVYDPKVFVVLVE
ncbi:hypothetical protein [Candidatus Methylacidithermus pantelleriae]|uniref:hypothetical protein n=1 Tax=Candidatus Methylacidithermus pantelleriae TaxID=2744239 RepID=UPI001BD416A2|nr:hypothetical protein [Candidatus Methylacidithermus pantelleriae]